MFRRFKGLHNCAGGVFEIDYFSVNFSILVYSMSTTNDILMMVDSRTSFLLTVLPMNRQGQCVSLSCINLTMTLKNGPVLMSIFLHRNLSHQRQTNFICHFGNRSWTWKLLTNAMLRVPQILTVPPTKSAAKTGAPTENWKHTAVLQMPTLSRIAMKKTVKLCL